MDHRQEARDQFDRLMRAPDRIVEIAALFGVGMPLLFLMDGLLGGPGLTNSELVFYISIKLGVLAVYVLYFATRFAAALTFAAIAVRRRDRTNARGADLRADRPDAQARTDCLIAAGN